MAAITAKVTGGPTATAEFNIPADLAGLVAAYGEDVVYGKAVDSIVIDVQALMRRHLKGTDKTPGKSEAHVAAIVAAYKPGAGPVRKSSTEKVADLIGKLTPEEKAALLKSLKNS